MTRSTFDFDRATQGNYAPSHGVSPLGELALVPPGRERQLRAVRPTGGAWSNVNDLLAYVRMELFGAWRAPVASRENADGAIDFVVVTPSAPFPFAARAAGARRTLAIRDAQNEYVFVAAD